MYFLHDEAHQGLLRLAAVLYLITSSCQTGIIVIKKIKKKIMLHFLWFFIISPVVNIKHSTFEFMFVIFETFR